MLNTWINIFETEQSSTDDYLNRLKRANLELADLETVLSRVIYLQRKAKIDVDPRYYILLLQTLYHQRKLKEINRHLKEIQRTKGLSLKGAMDAYLIEPNIEMFRFNFEQNVKTLQEWKCIFTTNRLTFDGCTSEVGLVIEWPETDTSALPNAEGHSFLFLVDFYHEKTIPQLLEKGYWLYLVFDDPQMLYNLLLFSDPDNLKQIVRDQRMVIFGDRESVDLFFGNTLTVFPNGFFIMQEQQKEYYTGLLSRLSQKRELDMQENIKKIKEFCRKRDNDYYTALFSRSNQDIKILIVNSLHTQVNQHICRNWFHALKELGYQVQFLIEDEKYQLNNYRETLYEKCAEFEPDIVLHVNFDIGFVFEDEEIRSRLLWIMRHRDRNLLFGQPIPFDHNMVIAPVIKTWAEVWKENGLPANRTFYFPDGIDMDKFVPFETEDEVYQADIVLVANNNVLNFQEVYVDKWLGNLPDYFQKTFATIIYEVIDEFKKRLVNQEPVIHNGPLEKCLIEKLNRFGVELPYSAVSQIAIGIKVLLIAYQRQLDLEWILESGVTNRIRIWGRGWEKIEKFRPYVAGVAHHGSQLATIYKQAKIALSNHPEFSLHERNFEILAGGGFPLVRLNIAKEDIYYDAITNYFAEDKEIVVYRNKHELIEKIRLYLHSDELRRDIAARGRSVVASTFSHTAVARKLMEFLKVLYNNKP